MVNYTKLTKAGIDMESLVKRLMGNDSLVRVFIKKFTEDTTFDQLTAAFSENDMKKAEMASHTLKGMCGNLSLTELYALFTEQVEHIRRGEGSKAEAMMEIISAKYGYAISNMRDWLTEN